MLMPANSGGDEIKTGFEPLLSGGGEKQKHQIMAVMHECSPIYKSQFSENKKKNKFVF
jgi:hypothetical protein